MTSNTHEWTRATRLDNLRLTKSMPDRVCWSLWRSGDRTLYGQDRREVRVTHGRWPGAQVIHVVALLYVSTSDLNRPVPTRSWVHHYTLSFDFWVQSLNCLIWFFFFWYFQWRRWGGGRWLRLITAIERALNTVKRLTLFVFRCTGFWLDLPKSHIKMSL